MASGIETTTQPSAAQAASGSGEVALELHDMTSVSIADDQRSPLPRSNTASPTLEDFEITPTVVPITAEHVYGEHSPVLLFERPTISLPPNWTRYVHPNGRPYFVNKELMIVTYENINDSETLKRLKTSRDSAFALAHEYSQSPRFEKFFKLPDDYEFFIELQGIDQVLVDHTRRYTTVLKSDHPEVDNRESTYWEHVRKTPMHRILSPGAEDEMLAALTHDYAKRIQEEPRNPSPFSRAQCESLMSLYTTVKHEISETNGVRTWFVSHLLVAIWKAREMYKYGEYDAVFHVDKPDHEMTMTERILDVFLMFACFGTHLRYRNHLLFSQTHGGINVSSFQKPMDDMVQEWTDSNLLGTVFVSADVAFLSVQGIERTEQAIVLASTLFAIASIIAGVHHLWKHRSKTFPKDNQPYVVQPPSEMNQTSHLRTTFSAVFLSFPLVFLDWSIGTFLVGLLVFAFRTTTGNAKIILGFIIGLISIGLAGVYWFFYAIWEDTRDKERWTWSSVLKMLGLSRCLSLPYAL